MAIAIGEEYSRPDIDLSISESFLFMALKNLLARIIQPFVEREEWEKERKGERKRERGRERGGGGEQIDSREKGEGERAAGVEIDREKVSMISKSMNERVKVRQRQGK